MRVSRLLIFFFILLLFLPVSAELLISEVAPNTYAPYDEDEFIRILCLNRTENLGDYSLSDLEETVNLPPIILKPGESVYLTRNATLFRKYMREDAVEIPLPRLSNSGDELLLLKGSEVVDAVRYGESREIEGWRGEPLDVPREGEILKRWNGDTDGREDWEGERPFYIGQSEFSTVRSQGSVLCFTTRSSLEVLLDLLEEARNSVCVATYLFDHPLIAEKLRELSERGVKVRILVEGDPAGGFEASESLRMVSESSEVRIMSSEKLRDRYRFMHAKCVVIDGKRALITTENLNEKGFPVEEGNVGWGVVISGEGAEFLQRVFEDDWNGYDVRESSERGEEMKFESEYEGGGEGFFSCSATYEVFVLPDSEFSVFLKGIDEADEFLYLEQQYIERDGTLMREILRKASEGLEVRILLNDDEGNRITKEYLEEISKREGLDLEVRLLENLHTKAIVSENFVIITSANMNDESILLNREAGVILYGEPAKFFREVFEEDWSRAKSFNDGMSAAIKLSSGVLIALIILLIRHFLILR
ncbi:MAG: hypothetical protein PWR13_339 [Archaeoglobi archaeon]|nr:hypothetical protein [Archaeoglobi archaeon]